MPFTPARLTQGSLVKMSPPLARQRSCQCCAISGKSSCAIRTSLGERVETVVVLAAELELMVDVELFCKPVGSELVEFTAEGIVELSADDAFAEGIVVFERSGPGNVELSVDDMFVEGIVVFERSGPGNVVALDGVDASAAQAGGESTRLCKM